jgi:hypothetical protein
MGGLNRGIQIETRGLVTCAVAWFGNRFTTQSVHEITLGPGDENVVYPYGVVEEALLRLWCKG